MDMSIKRLAFGIDLPREHVTIITMKKNIIIAAVLLSMLPPHVSWAGPQDKRRIEEQKRGNLEQTEVHYQKKKKQPARAPSLLPDEMIYLTEMSFRRITYGYDLCKTIVILKGVENEYLGLDAQVAYLKEQNLLPRRLRESFDPMKPLRRGLAAYVLRRVLDVKGGIFLTLFKESQRYALKELTYQGVMSSGNINEILNGDELAATITRAVNYMTNR